LRDGIRAGGGKQPHLGPRTERHALQFQYRRLAVPGEGIDPFPICSGRIALGIAAHGPHVELRIAIENLLQLPCQLSAVLQPPAGGKFPEIEVPPGPLIVPRAAGRQKAVTELWRRFAIQGILVGRMCAAAESQP
jgi:hypothetical protein